MLQAIGTVRPALDSFYNSLNDEQKAAFDAIGPERSGNKTASAADNDETPQRHRHRHLYGYNNKGNDFPYDGFIELARTLVAATSTARK
jgi:LTXXQ motif family protein